MRLRFATPRTLLGLGLFSLIYYFDAISRAKTKLMWFDEIFTYYICALPDMKSAWSAVTHGADFNPPLFYFLTRVSEFIFGDGTIGIRVPSMIGFWLLCICLYVFVAKRSGPVAGIIAGLFPLVTAAKFYTVEARPHAIVLGFCGLAIVAWQNVVDRRRVRLWLPVFGCSVLAALLTHFYAVFLLIPLGLAELYRLWENRRADWGIWGVMFGALVVAAFFYVPLYRAFRATSTAGYFEPSLISIHKFYVNQLAPTLLLLLFVLVLLCWDRVGGTAAPTTTPAAEGVPRHELVLAIAFTMLPFAGFVVARISGGPFVDRYFLMTLTGFAILLGTACSTRYVRRWISISVAACLMFLVAGSAVRLASARVHNADESLVEPSSNWPINTSGVLTASNSILFSADKQLDIMIPWGLDYIYLYKYLPADMAARLWLCTPDEGDHAYRLYKNFREAVLPAIRMDVYPHFLQTHQRFLVYGVGGMDSERLNKLLALGATIKSERSERSQVLYEVVRNP